MGYYTYIIAAISCLRVTSFVTCIMHNARNGRRLIHHSAIIVIK